MEENVLANKILHLNPLQKEGFSRDKTTPFNSPHPYFFHHHPPKTKLVKEIRTFPFQANPET